MEVDVATRGHHRHSRLQWEPAPALDPNRRQVDGFAEDRFCQRHFAGGQRTFFTRAAAGRCGDTDQCSIPVMSAPAGASPLMVSTRSGMDSLSPSENVRVSSEWPPALSELSRSNAIT